MSNGNKSNEEIFIEAAKSDDAFRKALRDKDSAELRGQLDRLGINVRDKEAVIEAIKKIDWSDLSHLEHLVGDGTAHPLN
jgi:hypothetical protein